MAQDTARTTAKLRGLTAKFDNRLKSFESFYPKLCTVVNSTGADERYALLGNVQGVREWIGDREFGELRASDWTLANKTWEVSQKIEREDIEDDRLGMYVPVLEQLAIRAAAHPDELLFTLINAAESTDCFDGQTFFDTDHAWGDSGAQDNDLTGACAAAAVPTVAEFQTAFDACRQALLGFKDDRGKRMNGMIYRSMKDLTLLLPPAMERVALEALTAALGSAGGTNIVIDRPTIIVSPEMSSSAKFDVYVTNMPLKPYIFQARKPLRRQMKGTTDIEYKDVKFMTEARYNLGYGAWWTAVRYTFT